MTPNDPVFAEGEPREVRPVLPDSISMSWYQRFTCRVCGENVEESGEAGDPRHQDQCHSDLAVLPTESHLDVPSWELGLNDYNREAHERLEQAGLIGEAFPYNRPDGSDADMFIQWKNTNLCVDFTCPCGQDGHFDGFFAKYLRCAACGAVFEMGTQVIVRRVAGVVPFPDLVQDVRGDSDDPQ